MARKRFNSSYTLWIIIINVVAFIIGLVILNNYGESEISLIALQPAAVLAGKNLWTFITSMFMHANLTHLFVNMLSLLFIGSFVERLIGKRRFLIFYLASGIIAGLFFVLITFLFSGDMDIYAVGASGAIFGLGGLLAVLTPKLKVLVFFIIPMPMWIAMIFLLGILWLISITSGLAIGNSAHLGGLIAGLAYGFYLKLKYPAKTRMIQRYFSR